MASAASSGDCAATASDSLTCPVCLASLTSCSRKRTCELGKPKSCDHIFCFSCIFEWSKNVNTCPVDRLQFNEIEVYKALNSTPIRKVAIPNITLGSGISEDVTYCEVCAECSRENSLLLCDGCDKGYHLDCLSPPLLEIPEGDWYCESCNQIVQSQYDISMSSPDEETDYNDVYSGLQLLINSDNCSSSDEHIDITGSDSDSSNIVVDSEPESDLGDAGIAALASSTDTAALNNHVITPSLEKTASRLEASNSDNSCSEEEIVRPARHFHVNVIDISSSDDSGVLVRRSGPNNRKRIFTEDSDSGGEVDEDDEIFKPENTVRSLQCADNLGLPENSGSGNAISDSDLLSRATVGCSNVPATCCCQSGMMSCTTPGSDFSLVRNSEKISIINVEAVNVRDTSDHVCNHRHFNQPGVGKDKRRKILSRKRKRPKRKRNTGRRRRRRKPKGYTGLRSILNSWVEKYGAVGHARCVSRIRARTAATHTPRPSAMRMAVQESYRHQDQVEGLEWARTVFANAVGSPHRMANNTNTPVSGYIDRRNHLKPSLQRNAAVEGDGFDDGFIAEDGNDVKSPCTNGSASVCRTYGLASSCNDSFRPSELVSAKPVSLFFRKNDSPGSSCSFDDGNHSCGSNLLLRQRAEIKRRLSTRGRTLSHVLVSPLRLPEEGRGEGGDHKAGPSRRTGANSSQAPPNSDLVGTLCQRLDDLNDNDHVIKRDGTVVTKRKFDSSTNSQKTLDTFKSVHFSVHMAVPEASALKKYPLPHSHISQRPRRSSVDDFTKRVFPVLKGDTKGCQEDHSYRSLQKRWGSKSSGNAGGGGRKCLELETDDGGRNATSGDGGRNATSGDGGRNATSGDGGRNATSGDGGRNATSGDGGRNATSGDGGRNATSGDGGRIATSGDGGRNATSGDGGRNATSGDGGRNATSGDGGGRSSGGGCSSAPLKHDSLLQYKIPKLNTTGIVMNGRDAPQSLKKDVITSASKAIHTFDCTVFERDSNPNDPLIQSVAVHTPTEMKLQDMSNNCVILTPSLSPKQSHFVPSLSASSRCTSPTLTQKSLDDCTSSPKELIRRALDVYFDKGTITNRQYKRILERATRKVQEGLVMSSYMNKNRVKKLVSDFVEAYKYHGTWS